jgi:putative ABC transport system permease protein
MSLAGLWGHKRRLIGTFLAVFLGVAFLAGTLVLSATLSSSINDFFVNSNAGTDVVVRSATKVSDSPAASRGPIDSSIVDQVRQVPGVAVAEPSIQGFGQIVGRDGKAVTVNGPRTASNWLTDTDLNPYKIVEGRPPQADNEVVVNRGTANAGKLRVGDVTTVLTPAPVRVTVAGIATFGTADAFGGTSYVGFTLNAAQRELTNEPQKVSSVSVKAASGVGDQELARRIGAALPSGVQAITGADLTAENMSVVEQGFLTFFRAFLTTFAAIALLVATISIYNTFSIIVAQRTRESALLRAVGASRTQVLATGGLEALAIGVVATGLGLAGGIGLAALLKSAFAGLGFDLPASRLIFTPGTAAICSVVGVVVTLVAAAGPALRASRVAPLAAMRDVAIERTQPSRTRVAIGGAFTVGGVATVLTGISGGSGAVSRAGIGALLVLLGVVTLGPAAVRMASALIGVGSATRGEPRGRGAGRLSGITRSLARRNAARNPRRTSGAAAALMIGVGVVTLFTFFAASLTATLDNGVTKAFTGDLAITAAKFGNGGVSPRLGTDLAALPQVRTAVGIGGGRALVAGQSATLTIANPAALGPVLRVDPTSGTDVYALQDRQLGVTEKVAKDRGWHIGSTVPVGFADGTTETATLAAIYRANPLLDDYLLPTATWSRHTTQYLDGSIYVRFRDGVDLRQGRAAVVATAQSYGAPTVQNRQEFIDANAQSVGQLLSIVYVMLVLAIVIALMGIANTLSLSIHERTRELGLLRAVGATRRQVRSMVRWESVLTALFGTLGGLALGSFLGWALVRAADTEGTGTFSAPPVQLIVVLIGGALAGLLAGLLPARRAAALNTLQAIATD